MARLNDFNKAGLVGLTAGIVPANNNTFPLVDAHDVQIDNSGTRLDSVLDGSSGSINTAINSIQDAIGTGPDDEDSTILKRLGAVESGKQDALSFDNAPTNGSTNMIKSGAVYTAVNTVATDLSNNYYTKTEIDDLVYTVITLAAYINIGSSASGSATTVYAEKGSSNTVWIKWTCSRTPKTLSIDGTAQATPSAATGTVSFSNVRADHTYPVVVTDQKNAQKTANPKIVFADKAYYGVKADPGAGNYNSAFLTGSSGLNNAGDLMVLGSYPTGKNNAKTYSVTIGSGTYGWLAIPKAHIDGGVTIGIDDSEGGYDLMAENVTITNASGGETAYNIYRTTNPNLGTSSLKMWK